MNPWYIGGIVLLVALVAMVVYFATRQTAPQSPGLFGTSAGTGRASAIGGGISGALAGLGAVATSIGSAVDMADNPSGVGA